ncbi:MAG: FAD-dependent oxidoreductase [Smithella sp.]
MRKNLVIIGGGAGGASTAAEAKRNDPSLNVTILERGKFVSFASCPMPYYIADEIPTADRLIARTPEKFRETGIEVKLNTEVLSVNYEGKTLELHSNKIIPFDVLVIGTGAKSIIPDIPGADRPGIFTLKNLEDGIKIKTYLREKKCRKAVIIGAGFISMEMCESLQRTGVRTTVLHRGTVPANRWDPELAKLMLEELQANGIEFVPEAETTAIEEGKDSPLCAVTNRGNFETDLILLAVGVRPNVDLADKMGIRLGPTGAIAVNDRQQTSLENVYAAGDCCESYHRISKQSVNIPLGDIANKQGRVAGRNIGGKIFTFPGIVGAQSFRLFNLDAGATGIDEAEAIRSGYDPASVLVWGNGVADPMGMKKIGLKLIADKSSGKILGAQTVGYAGAVDRINTLSAALWSEMTIDEIGWMDLAYAPPFSGPWDIIHYAAQALRRKI